MNTEIKTQKAVVDKNDFNENFNKQRIDNKKLVFVKFGGPEKGRFKDKVALERPKGTKMLVFDKICGSQKGPSKGREND